MVSDRASLAPLRCLPVCIVTVKDVRRCRKGKRSALVDHHMKNKQHRMLMAEMDKSLRKVTIVSGMAQRLTNKVAIVTGAQRVCWSHFLLP